MTSRTRAPGSYRPGTSVLHRLRPGAKLLGLLALGIVVLAIREWVIGVGALALALVATGIAGVRLGEVLRILRAFALVGLLLFAFQAWMQGWIHAVTIVSGVCALILAATAVTASTSITAMLDTIVWICTPLHKLGVSPERVSLTFSLAFRSLPIAYDIAAETREAAKARGLDRTPRALLVPFVLRMVMHARHTGAALHARGIDDD